METKMDGKTGPLLAWVYEKRTNCGQKRIISRRDNPSFQQHRGYKVLCCSVVLNGYQINSNHIIIKPWTLRGLYRWDFSSEFSQVHLEKLWEEYDRTDQRSLRRKRWELQSGLSCDKCRKLPLARVDAAAWSVWLERDSICRAKHGTKHFFPAPDWLWQELNTPCTSSVAPCASRKLLCYQLAQLAAMISVLAHSRSSNYLPSAFYFNWLVFKCFPWALSQMCVWNKSGKHSVWCIRWQPASAETGEGREITSSFK